MYCCVGMQLIVRPEDEVPILGKKRKLVSIPRDKVLTVATNRSVPAGTFQQEGPQDVM